MTEPKPTETPRPKLLDLMDEVEYRALNSTALSDWEAVRRTNDALRSLIEGGRPISPFPPQPTLDDLLAACDIAEEGGAPPEVVRVLRNAARNHMTLSEIIATNVALDTENTQLRGELERLSHARTDAR
jgi:hypothetical protein